MPSVPGSLLVIIDIQAGTVMGGVMLFRGPYVPLEMRLLRCGRSPRQASKTNSGGTQSSPMTKTFLSTYTAHLAIVAMTGVAAPTPTVLDNHGARNAAQVNESLPS